MLKWPPFSAYLRSLLLHNDVPTNDVYLFVGHKAYSKAEAFHSNKQRLTTIYLPPYECPSMYEWPVKSCDVLIWDTGWCEEGYLNDLAYYLYQFDANIVRCLTPEFQLFKFNK